MTDYAVTGKKRSGKGLFCAGIIRDALASGKRVATNMDIWPEKMLPVTNRATFYRLPDCPTAEELEAIGLGYEGDDIDDEKNGVIILDEASKYFNARAYQDKTRQPMLDWLIHSGKLRWDVYYQMQGLSQVDKQIRETQVEYHIGVKNTRMWPIPFVTPIMSIFGFNVRFPRLNIGIIKQGCERDSLVVGRKYFRSKDIFQAYDTEQKFLDRNHPMATGFHTVLSPWHVKGRHMGTIPTPFIRFFYGLVGKDWTTKDSPKKSLKKPKLDIVQKLSKLSPDAAIKQWHRCNALGMIK